MFRGQAQETEHLEWAPELGRGWGHESCPPEQAAVRQDLAADEAAARWRQRKRTFQVQRP